MAEYRFEREARTAQSEQWAIETDERSIGRVDLHFTASTTYATLAVNSSIGDEEAQALIAEIDDRIVMSADPYREDFIVTVWRGEEVGVFADEADDEAEDAEGEAPA